MPEFYIKPLLRIQERLSSVKKVFCSFSGGADSLVLLLVLKEWTGVFHFTLEAIHFEHGFRGEESLRDAEFCRSFCEQNNIPFRMYHLAVPEHKLSGEGDEEAARRMRHEMWSKIVDAPENTLIALGHHANDRTENILLRLFRGSNASGLTSMRSVQQINGLTFIRPLLEISRSEIEAELKKRDLTWCHDSTNDSDLYGRNFIRLRLLPQILEKFPFAFSGIRQSLRTLEDDAECLEEIAEQNFDSASDSLSAASMQKLHSAIRVRVLRLFLQKQLQNHAFVPDVNLLKRFEELVQNPRPAKIQLSAMPDIMLELRHGMFVLQHTQEKQEQIWNPLCNSICGHFHARLLRTDEVHFTNLNHEIFLDAGQVKLPFTITVWKEGDSMIPFAHEHKVTLKKLFSDACINTSERAQYPVLRDAEGTVFWVAGLRCGNYAVITEKTETVLHLNFD